jgi:hypothetical protein
LRKHLSAGEQRDAVERAPDQAADDRSVDPDELQIRPDRSLDPVGKTPGSQ